MNQSFKQGRCTEWRSRHAAWQLGRHGGVAIDELNRSHAMRHAHNRQMDTRGGGGHHRGLFGTDDCGHLLPQVWPTGAGASRARGGARTIVAVTRRHAAGHAGTCIHVHRLLARQHQPRSTQSVALTGAEHVVRASARGNSPASGSFVPLDPVDDDLAVFRC